jgi:cysteine desulfurase
VLYLDHAATTPVLPEALQAAWPWLTEEYGNPNSTHELGLRAAGALNWARERAADFLGCHPSEIVFTSGGTESNNLAIKGIALANPRGKKIISAKTEHESVLQCLEFLERVHGFEIVWLNLDGTGVIDLHQLEASLSPEVTLVALMAANNEVGTLHPIARIAQLCKAAKVPFHTDAVQAAGWLDLSVLALEVSALSLSGHKFGAPKGIGLLYLSGKTAVEALLHGGGQEFDRRSGTQNVAWAVALATSLNALEPAQTAAVRVASVTSAFIDEVLKNHPHARLTGPNPGKNFHDLKRHPAIASFTFEGLNGETLLLELENQGVICSSGSACAAGSTDPSHVLIALGIPEDLAQTSVRFSFGHKATMAEARTALDALEAALGKLTN